MLSVDRRIIVIWIHEIWFQWKINKIIVKDSSLEFDWIYLCIQVSWKSMDFIWVIFFTVSHCMLLSLFIVKGKCSVVKVLDLQVPLKLARSRRMTKDEVYYPKGLVRKKNRFLADTSKIWIKELHKSLENSFSFGGTKMVDECYQECDNERLVEEVNQSYYVWQYCWSWYMLLISVLVII